MRTKGFAILIAVVTIGTLLVVVTGVVSLAYKQALLASSSRESQYAFYAADTGMECALYWDLKNIPTAFATTTTKVINCNRDASNPSNRWTVGGASGVSTFTIRFLPGQYCAIVTVQKQVSSTAITSKGYNTCSASSRRVERAVQATY